MEIKVGDEVYIKDDLEVGRCYGSLDFIYPMLEFTGQFAEVVGYELEGYNLDIDGQVYIWSKDMLEFPDKEDLVNNPSHYNFGKYEVLDVIEDWQMNYHLGNAIKYIGRCEHKGNKIQDLEKAIFYIQREIDNEKEK